MTPSKVPCPNPACTAVFRPESLRGASKLTCPRCGTAFEFRATPGKPSSGSLKKINVDKAAERPRAKPDAPRSTATGKRPSSGQMRVAPTVDMPVDVDVVLAEPEPIPTAAPVAAAPDASEGLAFAEEPLIRSPLVRKRRRGGWQRALVIAAVLLATTGAAVGGLWWAMTTIPDAGDYSDRNAAQNFVLPHPGRAWSGDDVARLRMQVNYYFRRVKPTGAMALLVRDYKTRLPSEAEMLDEALNKLRNNFPKLDQEMKPAEGQTLGGQPARVLSFQATDADEVDVVGEVYMLAYRGYGYWLFGWHPVGEEDAMNGEWERVRNTFTLGNKRDGWKEKPRDTDPLAVPEAGLQLAYAKGVWEEDDPASYDPAAKKVLRGSYPSETPGAKPDKLASRKSIVRVLVLDRKDNLKAGAAAARDYVLENQKDPERGGYPATTLVPLKDKDGTESDREMEFGLLHGRLMKFEMRNSPDLEKFLMLGVVNQPKGLVVFWCESGWDKRDFWEQEFTTLLSSLQPLKRGETAPPGKAGGEAKEMKSTEK
jgi:hypothetical protein